MRAKALVVFVTLIVCSWHLDSAAGEGGLNPSKGAGQTTLQVEQELRTCFRTYAGGRMIKAQSQPLVEYPQDCHASLVSLAKLDASQALVVFGRLMAEKYPDYNVVAGGVMTGKPPKDSSGCHITID